MRGKGINYDTGFRPGGRLTRAVFDADVVRRDMRAIADDLHCTAVRVSGCDIERLTVAAEHAAAAGLDVWLTPFACDMPARDMLHLFEASAERAEALRARSDREVVLMLGGEISVFAEGFVPGADVYQRLAHLSAPTPEMYASYGALLERLNAFLNEAASAARRRFGGRITYASGFWEQIDWRPFDIVGVDAYRDAANSATFVNQLRGYVAHGKAVAVAEFGCCTYRGAARVQAVDAAIERESVAAQARGPAAELGRLLEQRDGAAGARQVTGRGQTGQATSDDYGVHTCSSHSPEPTHAGADV
jgi:hypothetical protein